MKKKNLVVVVVFLLLITLLASCAPQSAPTPAPAPSPTPAPAPKPAPEFRFNIIAGTIGGGTNVLASAMAAVAKKYGNIDSTILSGMVAEMGTSIIQDGTANIGTTPSMTSYQSYYGQARWEGKPWKDSRTLWWGFEAEMQIMVPADSNIRSLRDLVGKTVSPGEKSFLSDTMFESVLKAMGISYGTDVKIVYMSHSEAAGAFGTRIDAYVVAASAPHPTFATVDLTRPVRLLQLNDEEMKTVRAKNPFFSVRTIKAGTYKGTTVDTTILSHPYALGASAQVPEDKAYSLVKNFLSNPDFVATIYKAGADIIKDGRAKKYAAENVAAPFHFGAYKFYQEAGWPVHPDMVPPEAKK